MIVDDEPNAVNLLEVLIGQTTSWQLVARCYNALEAISFLKNNSVDLVFLDINMPLLTGMELAALLSGDTAIVFTADSSTVSLDPAADTAGMIQLVKNDNDEITYLSQAAGKRFAVFSEVYYNRGWRAWIDDYEVPIIRTNYVLRGLSIPPGRHIIRFFFRPMSYYVGRQVQWMASIIFLLMLAGAIIVAIQERRRTPGSLQDSDLLQAA